MSKTTRRTFLHQAAAVAGVGLAPEWASGCADDGRPLPNVLIVLTDQQSTWTVGAYGGDECSTPNIDALASDGVLCENFLANSAVCTPARGCLVSGLYPHVHGARANDFPMLPGVETFATVMRDAGYRTGWSGKWHLDGLGYPGWVPTERAFGFDDSRYMWNNGHYKKVIGQGDANPLLYWNVGNEQNYTTDWLASRTIDFVRDAVAQGDPFLYVVSIPDPHAPFVTRAPYSTRFAPEDVRIPSTLFETDLPAWVLDYPARVEFRSGETTLEGQELWLRKQKTQYLGMVELIDDALGRILAELDALGAAEDTIVVFTSDHGEYMGEHGLMEKGALYEPASHVPLIFRYPRGLPAGRRVANLMAGIDFMPTLLGLCDLPSPEAVQGRDASPLLLGAEVHWDEVVHLHHAYLAKAGIFTDSFQLMLVEEGGHMLFDRKNDPEQANDLLPDPAYASIANELLDRVVEHNLSVESPAASWLVDVELA